MLAEVKETKSQGGAMDGVPESLTREGWIRLGGKPWGKTVNMRKYMITEAHLVSYYSVRLSPPAIVQAASAVSY